MEEPSPVVQIVDDEPAMRECIQRVLQTVGIQSTGYPTATAFLKAYQPETPGCLLLDVRLPEMDGLELQQYLQDRGLNIPIVFLSGYADFDLCVSAMKRGAMDFLSKPFSEQALIDSVKAALLRDRHERDRSKLRETAQKCLARLTTRERDVLALLLQGKSNKAIAVELGVSHKTVEFHRSRIMMKSRCDSIARLVRISMMADPQWAGLTVA